MEKDVLRQLSHKERHVTDLVAFLKNKCEKAPNYTLLMGAGCSVTSGISTGADLVKKWKNEIFEIEKKDGQPEEDFWKEQYSWYNPRNQYSSLFQKKYDLPRQRRIFVENEVAGKNPAIGYAYLIKLIENNYLNTVFTTNFDDLLNEAFYRFSSTRPIVCAHDSSITSITVTSSRPKIIKLHGDYLFDDIKSTLRETESLNDNMKAKFIEFAKDHGLIVVGYAGNDRSIMDILTMLLQKADYFKYGIYWCIRQGDSISDELRQLLWKDRVYFVQIPGFDELMAELNLHLNEGKLPIEDELLSSKKQKKMIEDLTNKEYFSETTRNNNIIKKDIERLSKSLSKNIINDFFEIVNEKNRNIKMNPEPKKRNNLRVITDEERKILDNIKDLIEEENKDDALILLNRYIDENTSNSQFLFSLYDLRIGIYKTMPDKKKELQESFDKLIELQPNNEDNYLRAFKGISDYKKKLFYINQAIKLFPYDAYLYNEKASFMIDECLDICNDDGIDNYLSEIKTSIDTSLGINDTPFNRAWLLKCEYLNKVHEKEPDRKKQEIKTVILNFSNIKSRFLAMAYSSYYKLLDMSKEECDKQLQELYSYSLKTDNLLFIETCAISLLVFYRKNNDINSFEKFVKSYEKDFIPSEDFEYNKALAYMNNFAKFEFVEDIILSKGGNSNRWNSFAFDYLCNTNQKERALSVLNKYFKNDVRKLINYYSMAYDERLIDLFEDYWSTNPRTLIDVSKYACVCLKHGKYDKAYFICKKYYDNPDYFDGVLYINYFLADKKYNKKDNNSKIQNKILKKKESFDTIVIAAAYALIGDKNSMYSHLNSAIKENVLYKFDILEWPVFEEYANEDKFKALADTSKLMSFENKISDI